MTILANRQGGVQLTTIKRWLQWFERGNRANARWLLKRADAARDARRFQEAAGLYEASLDLRSERTDLYVQAGHMRKEAGDYDRAAAHYRVAAARMPGDPDLALQLGHFYAVTGDLVAAAEHYRRALELRPEWGEATRGLTGLRERDATLRDLDLDNSDAIVLERDETIVRALLPSPPADPAEGRLDTIELRRLGGRPQRCEQGSFPVLSGVESVRGVCFSQTRLDRAEFMIDGETVQAEPIVALQRGDVFKHVFNLWIDLSGVQPGLRRIDIVLTDGEAVVRRPELVLVTAPLPLADHAGSDSLLTVDPTSADDVEAQINAMPSVVRGPARSPLQRPIRNILVQRTDQLGDLVVSIPGLRRLRELFPEAHIVGLVTEANVDLARQLGVFDETIVVPFPDDLVQRRRVMTEEDQTALRKRLAPYRFDVAIDLAVADTSRPLLLLSGARYLYGFYDADWTWLSAGIDASTHDPKNDHEAAPQSGRIRALIERLGTIVDSGAAVIRRDEIDPARLGAFGVAEGRYIVLHTGARIAFSRWQHYPALAEALIRRTDLTVLLLTDDPAFVDTLPPSLRGSSRFRLVDRRLTFDDFDTLVAGCAVFVGNDSGPKHLASLRGVPVVSIHSARVNWSEWGQELTGTILSRRVPCARCAIYHDPDECGKGYACITGITVDEVLAAVLEQLPG